MTKLESRLEKAIAELANRAIRVAVLAAQSYAKTNSIKLNPLTLSPALRCEINDALPAALDDAKEAIGLGMGDVGTATFDASMRIAGIRAVKAIAQAEGKEA